MMRSARSFIASSQEFSRLTTTVPTSVNDFDSKLTRHFAPTAHTYCRDAKEEQWPL